MSKAPDVLAVVQNWAKKADHDLRNAEHTLEMSEDCPYDTICFQTDRRQGLTYDIRIKRDKAGGNFSPAFFTNRVPGSSPITVGKAARA